MILYFTYNDQPSGVYYSQVCDVVNYMNTLREDEVKLFALVSLRSWSVSRKAIRSRCPGAIVWPMVPKAKNWKLNVVLLSLICKLKRPSGILARGVFATVLAHRVRAKTLVKRVGFDGRGAYAAEWSEYRIIDDDTLISEMPQLERQAVNESDFRLAVSKALVRHWESAYGYSGEAQVIIPCTVSGGVDERGASRSRYDKDDIVLVYAGSTAGWQSFGLLEQLLVPLLEQQKELKVLFLSKEDENNARLVKRFGSRVQVDWLQPEEVISVLQECDYGILIRENTVTNQVASPTKFAEYLRAGLKVLISEGIGDMSEETLKQGLGYTWVAGDQLPPFEKVVLEEKLRISEYATREYSKEAYRTSYLRMIEVLT